MKSEVICVGAIMVDEIFFADKEIIHGTSNPAHSHKYIGGVVANISRHLALLGIQVKLISAVGNDSEADWIRTVLHNNGVNLDLLVRANHPSGRYTSFLQPAGTLFAAMCHDISRQVITREYLESHASSLQDASMVVCDANLHESVISYLISFCDAHQVPLVIEPVSVPRAQALSALSLQGVSLMTPNQDELPALANAGGEETALVKILQQKGLQQVWVRKGPKGSSLYTGDAVHHLGTLPVEVVDTTGAGDAALAGYLYAKLSGFNEVKSMAAGHSLAYAVIGQRGPVLENLSTKKLESLMHTYYPEYV